MPTAEEMRLALAQQEVATLRQLLAHAQAHKVDAIAALLDNATRQDLDLLRERHPGLMQFVLGHYQTRAG